MATRAADLRSFLLPPVPFTRPRITSVGGHVCLNGLTWRVAGRTITLYLGNEIKPFAKVKIGGTYPLQCIDSAVLTPVVCGLECSYLSGDVQAWTSANGDLAVVLYSDGGCVITTGKQQKVTWSCNVGAGDYEQKSTEGTYYSTEKFTFAIGGMQDFITPGLFIITPTQPIILSAHMRQEVPVRDIICMTSWCVPGNDVPKGTLPSTATGDLDAMDWTDTLILMHHGCMQKKQGEKEDGYKPPWTPNDLESAKQMSARLNDTMNDGVVDLFHYVSAHYHRRFETDPAMTFLDRVQEACAAFGQSGDGVPPCVYNDGWPCKEGGYGKRDLWYEYYQSRLLAHNGIAFIVHGTMVGSWPLWCGAYHSRGWLAGEGQKWDLYNVRHRARSPVSPWYWGCHNPPDRPDGMSMVECLTESVRLGAGILTFPYQQLKKRADGSVYPHWEDGRTEWYKKALMARQEMK